MSVAVLPRLYLPRHGLVLRSALERAALSLARCRWQSSFWQGPLGVLVQGESCCPQAVSCGVPALLRGGLQGLHLHSPSPPCSAPGCWLPQGAWPRSRDPPAPRSRSRDKGQRHQHTPQHFIATAAAGHPSSWRGSRPGPGPGLGSSPLILLGPLHDSHSPRLLHPGPHGAASRPHSCPVLEPDARPRVLSMPASFPRPSLRGAGGRAPPGL